MGIYWHEHTAYQGYRPDWLLTSAAARAQETSAYVAQAFELAAEQTVVERTLYLADPNQLLAALQETPADVHCTALVAHNPGLAWLVNELAEENQRIDAMPTLGSALFSADIADWSELRRASLVSFMTPRALKAQ